MEARRLMCGFADRHRHTWSAVRWATFNIMSATADMKKAGITSPAALLPLPWDKPTGPTKQEVNSAMKELMAVRRQVLESKSKG